MMTEDLIMKGYLFILKYIYFFKTLFQYVNFIIYTGKYIIQQCLLSEPVGTGPSSDK